MKPNKVNAATSVSKQHILQEHKVSKQGSNPNARKHKQKRPSTRGNTQQQKHHHDLSHHDPSKAKPKELMPLYLQKTAVGTVSIPHELHKGIHTVLQGVPRDTLKKEGTALSDTLRARTTTRKTITTIHFGNNNPSIANQKVEQISTDVIPPINYTEGRSLAYTAHRMPGVFACTHRVLNEVRLKLPDYAPQSMLDFGSGPGTSIWVASRVWPDSIKNTLAVEPSSQMIDVAQKMFAVDDTFQSMNLQWRRFLFATNEGQKYDLVTAAYVLSELKDNKERKEFAKNLWDATEPGGTLIIIEPGTPIGFEIIKIVRTLILSERLDSNLEAQIVGPCPHVFACPMQGKSWCHFIQRAQRIPLTLGAKLGASQNWEDEKYSYISFHKKIKGESKTEIPTKSYEGEEEIVSVGKSTMNIPDTKWSRIISPPLKRGGHIIMDFCTDDGKITRETVTKSYGNAIYKAARKSTWGDAFNLPGKEEAVEQREHRRIIVQRNKAVKKAEASRKHEEQLEKHETRRRRAKKTEENFGGIDRTEAVSSKQSQLQKAMDKQMNEVIKKIPTETLTKMLEQGLPNKGINSKAKGKPMKETKQQKGK